MVKDHHGNEYKDKSAMCDTYEISVRLFDLRQSRGWSIEDSLCRPSGTKKLYKYKDKNYGATEICEKANITISQFNNRLHSGWTIEEIVSGLSPNTQHVVDHEGNVFNNETQMCKHWGVDRSTYRSRRALGWTVEQSLTYKANTNKKTGGVTICGTWYRSYSNAGKALNVNSTTLKTLLLKYPNIPDTDLIKWLREGMRVKKPMQDPDGVWFPSFVEMCRFHDKNPQKVRHAISRKIDLKTVLYKNDLSGSNVRIRLGVRDHLGNPFPSIKAMCKAYKRSYDYVHDKLVEGYTLEAALTKEIIPSKKKAFDHKGNAYPSFKAMCEAYGQTDSCVYRRLSKGKSLKEALEDPGKKRISCEKFKKYQDYMIYKGERFVSPYKLYDVTGVAAKTLISGWEKGFSTEEIKYIMDNGGKVTSATRDFNGKLWPSMKQMCKAYHKSQSQVTQMIKRGATLKEALLYTPCHTVEDHLGNRYPTLKDMLSAWNITKSIYYKRKKNGWALKEILETPCSPMQVPVFVKGVRYKSVKDAIKILGISINAYRNRIKKGMTPEEALEDLAKEVIYVYDYKGTQYDSFSEMCRAYGKKITTVKERLKKGSTLEVALTDPVGPYSKTKKKKEYVVPGRKFTLFCGLNAQVISIDKNNKKKSVCLAEDGTKIIAYNHRILAGTVPHPNLPLQGKINYKGFTGYFVVKTGDVAFYKCECTLCGKKEVLPLRKMIEHAKTHQLPRA